jgi:hypothetical protein
MKKLLVTTAICLIGAASVMAQGRISFNNAGGTAGTPIRISGNLDGSASVILGTTSTAQFGIGPASAQIRLFAGLTSTSLAPVLIGTSTPGVEFVLNTSSGIVSAQGSFQGGGNLVLPFDGSAPVFLQFTVDSINGSYRGVSSIIQVALATGGAPSTAVFSATPNANQWSGITMIPVPEPSSMALAGLGAASLLLFRRRK